MKIGANYQGEGRCEFTVWAPFRREVAVRVVSPDKRPIPMQRDEGGYWKATAEGIDPGTLYFYKLDGEANRPDPASHSQPNGPHEASEVVDHSQMKWTDAGWSGVPLEEMIIYELHTGTFTPEGTFEAIISRLAELRDLGVNAIEIMPIAQFPGDRNWGYDGTYPYAVQNSYGGPQGLKQLVDAAHQRGISIILDVVYNHFGPEGNYTGQYGPYMTEKYNTPWGWAMNFDDAHSPEVRNYFIENALYWFDRYHIDALRLDAVHAMYDLGAKHFLQELADRVAALSESVGRKLYLIAESDLNDVRVIHEKEFCGYGMDAQWIDDFHHCLHTLLTGEQLGYYQDYGQCQQLGKAYKESFVYSWTYSPHRQRYHGSDASDRPGQQFVICAQNHDQVGNRMLGDRLANLVSFEALKLAAGALLLSPNIPLLFMGEEYGEESPFLYFVSHTDPDLCQAVREGRKKEFAAFHLEGEYIDPESRETFEKSKLKWGKREEGKHKTLREFYQHLIQLRRTIPALQKLDKQNLEASAIEGEKILFLHRWNGESQIYCIMNFNAKEVTVKHQHPSGNWHKILDSSDTKWMGSEPTLPDQLEPDGKLTVKRHSFALYQQ
ncbi:malto-oligosyltrehalose trehalohydrolase [Kamptonema formosum]|uniref:malto-oligosyltrehalose trehalohydrolase n=1 Tax=Kamptonema formosum TaxID=331992 RepID=UPI0003449334|nr:malto-oligosyltrehalose trehalohydrolase [Oscillatoria sp. PCC 10802]